ncbi:MAG TPA: glycoside hydrolase family 2 protein [Pirellulales bacterium]
MIDATATQLCEAPASAAIELGSWSCCAQPPGAIAHPDQLAAASVDWLPAAVPGTVAAALDACGRWSWDQPADIDAHDWWFRTSFQMPEQPAGHACHFHFDGLATLAEVWLNGQRLLATDNMFRAYRLDVSSQLAADNELVLGFRSLAADLKRKRPRPRWKTGLVNHQQLRWHRTALLGRIPGWSPVAPAVGPWRDVRLESSAVSLADVHVTARLEGTTGLVTIRARVLGNAQVERAVLRVGDGEAAIVVCLEDGGRSLVGELRIADPPLWWPHTHGDQTLLPCEVLLESADATHCFDCGKIGFRRIEVRSEPGFAIEVNGQPIYCRGACWTVSNLLTHSGSEASLRHDLRLARDAGVNMLRVGGTMTYESELFYQICDELGLLVWQDFMFANMDYPVLDESFRDNITQEASQQVARLARHPCVAVYCGNSEIEQQAAMLGMPRELWRNDWFGEWLPQLCAAQHPGTAYVPSTPSGGVLPFHASSGLTHYYGVGAYLRSPAELRQADVKFTPECLGFANVPDPHMIYEITGDAQPAIHDPKWKRRVPRDTGAGWDFEDVRDHYLREIYGLDPVQLRSWDMSRYLQLSRQVSGEMMARVFSEWRSCHSRNRGGLVWFYKDLWPGAGWGVVDSGGTPKAAYYHLKRTWQPRQLVLTDEGLNGLDLHLLNETAEECDGALEVVLLREPRLVVARAEIDVGLAARSAKVLKADELLGRFYDVNYAYRFGPPHHDVVVATWYDASRQVVSEAFHFVRRRDPPYVPAVIETSAEMLSERACRVSLRSDSFLHGVWLHAKRFLPDDNYFYLTPGRTKSIVFRASESSPPPFKGCVEALNLEHAATIALGGGA